MPIHRTTLRVENRKGYVNGHLAFVPFYNVAAIGLSTCGWKAPGWYAWMEPAWVEDVGLGTKLLQGDTSKQDAIAAGKEIGAQYGLPFNPELPIGKAFRLTPMEALAWIGGSR